MKFHEAVQAAFYGMITQRDIYKHNCEVSGTTPHHSLCLKFVETLTLILAPIAPHSCEYMWHKLGHQGSVAK